MDKQKQQFDVAPIVNTFVAAKEEINTGIASIAMLLNKIHTAQQKARQTMTKQVSSGNTVALNFSAQSVYVDNSKNGSSVTLTRLGGISFTVEANSQKWVHPLGGKEFDFDGGENIPCMFVDEFIPVG